MTDAMAPQQRLYSPEVADAILEQIAEGVGLRAICAGNGMPSRGTVHNWVINDVDGFAGRYARAREVALALMADDLLDISDDDRNDTYETEDGVRTNVDVIQRSRLRADTRRWLLSKLVPKTYGDKVTTEHQGPAGGPVPFVMLGVPPAPDSASWAALHKPEGE